MAYDGWISSFHTVMKIKIKVKMEKCLPTYLNEITSEQIWSIIIIIIARITNGNIVICFI
jgi:hypothetical protein